MRSACFALVFVFAQISANILLEYQQVRQIYYPRQDSYNRQIIPSRPAWDLYYNSYQPNVEHAFTNPPPAIIGDRLNSESINSEQKLLEPSPIKPEIQATNAISSTLQAIIVNRDKETTITPSLSLEYKPIRPSHASQIGQTLSQIIKPGKPWPSSPEGYESFQSSTSTKAVPSEQSPVENLTTNPEPNIEPTLVNRVNEASNAASNKDVLNNTQYIEDNATTTLNPQLNPSASAEPDNLQIHEKTNLTGFSEKKQSIISLEYKPIRPSFLPNPGHQISQIVPPGRPLPDSPSGYPEILPTTSTLRPTLENRVQSAASTTVISLEYVPSRPPFHPKPGNNINQIIPPGKPWPASAEDYQNFSQYSRPNLEERFKETTTQTGFIWQDNDNSPLEPKPAGSQTSTSTVNIVDRLQDVVSQSTSTFPKREQTQTPISLGYKPQLPSHHSKPGQTLITQIVKPGKPWPSSLEGYQNFSQTTAPNRNLENRMKEATPDVTEIGLSLDLGVLQTSPPRLRSEADINSDTFATLAKEKNNTSD